MRRNVNSLKHGRAGGFSIIELLIAIIIIGILATILIPILAGRTEKARIARAESDLERIADALERVSIDTSYYTRLFMLNDVAAIGPGTPFIRTAAAIDADPYDAINDYRMPGYFQNEQTLFIDVRTGLLLSAIETDAVLDKLETGYNWEGPYVNWQRDEHFYTGDTSPLPDGMPDDPWGNNYLFFTRAGLLVEPDGVFEAGSVDVLSDGSISITGPYSASRFDRATVLSMGPNGVPGAGAGSEFGQGDDIVRSFGQ